MQDTRLISKAHDMCMEHGHTLLFLTKFGSHLYGTNGPNSDTDVKGIFLPSKKSLILGNRCDHLTFSTGTDAGKNSSEDIDIQIWSIHYFLHLVQLGDTNALDLLYSISNIDCALFTTIEMYAFMYEHHASLYDKHKLHGYLGYVLGQAKKYGIKGSRLGVIRRVKEWYDNAPSKIYFNTLSCYMDTILEQCEEPSYCFKKEVNGVPSLVICGKVHQGTISMTEFAQRINRDFERYGERARLAEQDNGVDFKAISHAFRAITQMEQILRLGRITFPLAAADALKAVKRGDVPWKDCEANLLESLETLKQLQDNTPSIPADTNLIESFILGLYDERV